MRSLLPVLLTAGLFGSPFGLISAQEAASTPDEHAHVPGMIHDIAAPTDPGGPRQAGQSAYAAIAEIVAVLESDSGTDWSRVNLETLRQHLIDMDEVTLRSAVTTRPVEGGIEVLVTGTGRTIAAIRRMSHAHATALASGSDYRMSVRDRPSGASVRITGATEALAIRIRGLGFIGIMASGSHHAPHHLALARGDVVAGHAH